MFFFFWVSGVDILLTGVAWAGFAGSVTLCEASALFFLSRCDDCWWPVTDCRDHVVESVCSGIMCMVGDLAGPEDVRMFSGELCRRMLLLDLSCNRPGLAGL